MANNEDHNMADEDVDTWVSDALRKAGEMAFVKMWRAMMHPEERFVKLVINFHSMSRAPSVYVFNTFDWANQSVSTDFGRLTEDERVEKMTVFFEHIERALTQRIKDQGQHFLGFWPPEGFSVTATFDGSAKAEILSQMPEIRALHWETGVCLFARFCSQIVMSFLLVHFLYCVISEGWLNWLWNLTAGEHHRMRSLTEQMMMYIGFVEHVDVWIYKALNSTCT